MSEPTQYNRRQGDQRRFSWLFAAICVLFAANCAVLFLPALHCSRLVHWVLIAVLVLVCVADRRGPTRPQMLDLLTIATVFSGLGLIAHWHTSRVVVLAPLFGILLLFTLGGIYVIQRRKRTYQPRQES